MPFEDEKTNEEESRGLKRVIRFILGLDDTEGPITQAEIEKEKEIIKGKRGREQICNTLVNDSFKPMDLSCFSLPELKVKIYEPNSFDDCRRILDDLKNNHFVIVNFSKVKTPEAQKFFHFICGGNYVLRGKIRKVSNEVYAFSSEKSDIE